MIDNAAIVEALDINYCLTCSTFHTRSFCYMRYLNRILCTTHLLEFHHIFLISTCLNKIFRFAYNYARKFLKQNYYYQPSNQLNKIYPENSGDNSSKLIPLPNVTMLTIHLQDEDAENQQNSGEPIKKSVNGSNTSSSAVSVTSRISGGRLSGWIQKKNKMDFKESDAETLVTQQSCVCSCSYSENETERKLNQETQQPFNDDQQTTISKSKIPLPRVRSNFSKKDFTDEDSEVLMSSKTYRKSPWLFRKFKYKPRKCPKSTRSVESGSSEHIPKSLSYYSDKSPSVQTSLYKAEMENSFPSDISKEMKTADDICLTSCSSCNIPKFCSQFLAPLQPELDLNLADALRAVLNLLSQLRDGEAHVARIITKYIGDRSFERELLDAISNHAKLHLEAERRAQSVANEMWQQQSELMKNQEIELQENIGILIKENRQLQSEIENLTRKNEKLCVKLNQHPERRGLRDSSNQILENFNKNNEKLRNKASAMTAQIEENEKDLHKMQRKNQSLEQQLRNANSQLQNYKAVIKKLQIDHELEHAHLSHELQTCEITIKESVEAGDILLEDLDGLKRQLKTMPCSLNWTKLKSRRNNLPDFLYMCRSFINELGKELLNSQTELILKDKDNVTLKEELLRVEKYLGESKSEQERLNGQLETIKEEEIELKVYSSKYSQLEREFVEYKESMNKLVENLEKEKSSLASSFEDADVLNRQVIEKDEELNLSKEQMLEYKSENDTLRMQLHGLKQVFNASGTGDVARELADTQEKLTFFQSQYYQLLSEKNYLAEQLNSANLERGSLNEFQNSYYKFIQKQQQDLHILNEENHVIKQQLEAERIHVAALRTERTKLKDEKAVLKEIYHQLKSEINKVQKLEGEVVGMNMEANRLAIIAEYNKQLGEKLQCEVAERDVTISELQSNMKELNVAQVQNIQDKVALCMELTQVCTMNDKLSYSLVNEQQKSVNLDKTKKSIEDTAMSQLRAIEEMQKVERAALRDLLKDFKVTVVERNNLISSQNEYIQQISDLRQNALVQKEHLEAANVKHMQDFQIISNLQDKLKDAEDEMTRIHGENMKLENLQARQKLEVEQLKNQKEALDASIKYLQNTMQKLHTDLNDSRKTEVEAKLTLERETQRRQDIQNALDEDRAALMALTQENQTLNQKLANFNEIYEDLISGYKENMDKANKYNVELKKELKETKILLKKRTENLEQLEQDFAAKEFEVTDMQQYCDNLTEQLEHMHNSAEDIDAQSKLLSESNAAQAHLQDALTVLRSQHEECESTIAMLKEEKLQLQEKLENQIEEMESKCAHYTKYIEEIMRENDVQKNEMQAGLKDLSQKLQEMSSEFVNEKDVHARLLESHKDLAGKLLKSVRLLVDGQLNRQGAAASTSSISQQNLHLSSEKVAAESTIAMLSNELKDLRSGFEELTNDKKSIKDVLLDLRELHEQTLSRYEESQQELHHLKGVGSNTTFVWNENQNTLDPLMERHDKPDPFAEERIRQLKNELEVSHRRIMELTIEISNLKQELTVMEFQKSEVVLRLHETQATLNAEHNLSTEFMHANQRVLNEILEMVNNGRISQPVCETLLQILQGQESDSFEIPE